MAFFNPAILFACVLLVANQAFVQAANVAFEIRATWATGSPDGNSRKMIMVNDQFPGPQLTVNQGDQVQFTVHNALPFDLSVHFHGIEQKGTPWSDGVPGVSQRPIKPGQSFEYSWTATQHGVYWYHAHLRGLMMDGLYGTILIHPPADEPRPFSTISPNAGDIDAMKKAESNAQTVLISDWTKFTSEEWYAAEQASGLDIYCVDSILVNGKGSVECQPQSLLSKVVDGHLGEKLEKKNTTLSDKGCAPMLPFYLGEGEFPNTKPNEVPAGLQSGCKATNGSMEVLKVDAEAKWASLHFVSAMSLKVAVVSVDEHPMWIYAIDGQYIKPQIADTFILHNGERVSAMIKLDQTPGDYTIRIANNLPNQVISGYAKLSYARGTKTTASKPYIDYGSKGISDSVRALDDNKLIPFNAPPAAPYANQTIFLSLHRVGYNWAWTLNNKTSFSQDRETIPQPLLFTPNTTDPVDTS